MRVENCYFEGCGTADVLSYDTEQGEWVLRGAHITKGGRPAFRLRLWLRGIVRRKVRTLRWRLAVWMAP
jgi:hypothetical protein